MGVAKIKTTDIKRATSQPKKAKSKTSAKHITHSSENSHKLQTSSNISSKRAVRSTKNPKSAKISSNTSSGQTTFATGLSFQKLFFIFIIGSVFGTIYEDILTFVQTYLATGTGVWMLHRGVIYGPLNVIYGFGAALMCWVLLRKKYSNWQIFIYAGLLGGIVEYLLSFLQETFTHTTSWDYSSLWLNLHGRTTIPIMVIWGFLGWVLVKVIYPFISKYIEKIPPRQGNIIFRVLLVLIVLDCLISWSAIIRQTLRHNDIPAFTPVGKFYDYKYNDQFLEKYFPNMNHKDLP